VSHLTHQPKIGAQAAAVGGQNLQETQIHHVGGVQTQPINIVILNPLGHRPQQVIAHLRVVQVQLDQCVEAVPGVVGERIAAVIGLAEAQARKPAGVGRIRPAG